MDGVFAAAALLQTTPEVGTGQLLDYLPVLYRLAWFLGTFLAVIAVGWVIFEPAVSRIVRERNRNNPTVRDVITRYIRLLVVIVGLLMGTAAAGFGYVIGDSIIVIAAGTLAVGVAGQTVLGSLVSGLVLVADPEFNVGDYIEWPDGSGTIQSITLRVTRIVTPPGRTGHRPEHDADGHGYHKTLRPPAPPTHDRGRHRLRVGSGAGTRGTLRCRGGA
jgi:small conductance mechanosensitive channel